MADDPTLNEDRALIRLKGLSAAYQDVPLIAGLDLELMPGEYVGLRGPSGCGKTTLLRTVCRLDDPPTGEVVYKCRTDYEMPAYRRRVIYVQQVPALTDTTVEDNLRRPFAYKNCGADFPQDRAEKLLDTLLVGAERKNQAARSLSEGQKQRVCLIRALLLEPEVLLLDEPTSALDEDAAATVEEVLIAERNNRQLSALIISHDSAQAERLCNRLIDLKPLLVRRDTERS